MPAYVSWANPAQTRARTAQFIDRDSRVAHSNLPFGLVVDLSSVGAMGYLAGPDVYIYDSLFIANPIGSHTTIAVPGIPGHEKSIGPEWMIARFGRPGESFSYSGVLGLQGATDVGTAGTRLSAPQVLSGRHHQAPVLFTGVERPALLYLHDHDLQPRRQ